MTEMSSESELSDFAIDEAEEVSATSAPPTAQKGNLSYIHGLGLVIGLQVGSGIFSSPNQVHQHAGSYGASLLIWLCSGLLAWCGASCYSELGGAIPTSGGTQAYLKYIYNNYTACLYSWSAVSVMKPGSAGIIAIVLGEYLSHDTIIKRAVAFFAVVASALLNYWDVGASAGKFFLILKVALILGVFGLGIFLSTQRDHRSDSVWGGTNGLGDIIVALYGGIWAYDGWDNLNFVAGEMTNPTRDLPRVIYTAMPLVIIAYLAVNSAYFGALDGPSLDAAPSVALTMADLTGSNACRWIISIGIAGSCFGALNATMISMVKLTQVGGTHHYIPRIFKSKLWATVLQVLCTSAYIAVGEFKALVTFYGATMYLFYCFTISGLLYLRYKEPQLKRPYKTWLIAPILFLFLSFTLIGRTAFAHPLVIVSVFLFAFMGTPWYYYIEWKKKTNEGGEYELTEVSNKQNQNQNQNENQQQQELFNSE